LLEEGDETKLREKITVLQADTDRLGLMPSHRSWYEKLVPGAPSCKDLGTPWENHPLGKLALHWQNYAGLQVFLVYKSSWWTRSSLFDVEFHGYMTGQV
jgi:hypothetical protein